MCACRQLQQNWDGRCQHWEQQDWSLAVCIVVTGVGASWQGMGTTLSFICFVITTVPRRPVPRQGVFVGMMGVWIGFCTLSTLRRAPGHDRATHTECGSRGESWVSMHGSVGPGDFVTALGIQKEARWRWSDEESPAQWSSEQWWFSCWELGGCGTHGLLGLHSFLSAPDRFDCLVPCGIFSHVGSSACLR